MLNNSIREPTASPRMVVTQCEAKRLGPGRLALGSGMSLRRSCSVVPKARQR